MIAPPSQDSAIGAFVAAGAQARCFHCHAPLPEGFSTAVEEKGNAPQFCCSGCHAAYLLIRGAGLEDYYRRRQADFGLMSAGSPVAPQFSESYLERFVERQGGAASIRILMEGIRCAACIWLIEGILGRMEGVLDSRTDYMTHVARVVFDPARVTPGMIFGRIASLGYAPRPHTLSAAREAARKERRDLLVRFGTAAFLAMQLMVCSVALYAGYFQGMDPGMKRHLQFLSLLITTPILLFSGRPFLVGALRSLRNRAPNMDLLVSIGAVAACLYSVAALAGGGEVYFESAAMIITVLLAGRLLEQGARHKAAAGVERLLALAPASAVRLRGEASEVIDAGSLEIGDIVLVKPGDRFPADGVMTAGSTEVDESPLTGENMPVFKGSGDDVLAGTVNLGAPARVEVRRTPADSFPARIARLVQDAVSRAAPVQSLADRTAARLVPFVLVLALITLAAHILRGAGPGEAVMTAVSVVLIACPCALGLAIPAALVAGSGVASREGVIFRGGDVLERLSRITDAAFDKTGTLTYGKPCVEKVAALPRLVPDEVLLMSASLEASSSHPFAAAIAAHAEGMGMRLLPFAHAESFPGMGITGEVAGRRVIVGSERLLAANGIDVGDLAANSDGSCILVAWDGQPAGRLELKDRVREESAGLVGYFRRKGIQCRLLSGDRPAEAGRVAEVTGIERFSGGVLPGEKAAEIVSLREQGKTVLMVGDGINDAPALAAANVGCAFAGGTDVAMETSDLVLMRGDLELICFAHRVAVRTMNVVRQNLFWAVSYNAVGIPLAMTGRLTPVFAAAAMTISSLCVLGNSLRLTRMGNGAR